MPAVLRLDRGVRLPVLMAYTHRTGVGTGGGFFHQCVVVENVHGFAAGVRLRPPWPPGTRHEAVFDVTLGGPIRELVTRPVGHAVVFDNGSQVVARVADDAFSGRVWY